MSSILESDASFKTWLHLPLSIALIGITATLNPIASTPSGRIACFAAIVLSGLTLAPRAEIGLRWATVLAVVAALIAARGTDGALLVIATALATLPLYPPKSGHRSALGALVVSVLLVCHFWYSSGHFWRWDDLYGRRLVESLSSLAGHAEKASLYVCVRSWLWVGAGVLVVGAVTLIGDRSWRGLVRYLILLAAILGAAAASCIWLSSWPLAVAVVTASGMLTATNAGNPFTASMPLWVGVSGIAIGAFLLSYVPPQSSSEPVVRSKRIGILRGEITTTKPTKGPFQTASLKLQADFSELPRLLTLWGHQPKFISDSWKASDLADVDLLFVINPNVIPIDSQREQLERFVRAGGRMVVLGDHTDIMGIMKPLNAYLGFTDIRFNFDSAIPSARAPQWFGGLHAVRSLPAAFGEAPTACISVGATLSVGHAAQTLVLGQSGFSDAGDLKNEPGFLGNMAYDRGEPFGGLPLVAEQTVGKGHVMVWGDTSSFQSSSLPYSHPIVATALSRGPGRQGLSSPTIVGAGILVLLAGVLALSAASPAALLLTALLLGAGAGNAFRQSSRPRPFVGAFALLDQSHKPQYPTHHLEENIDRFIELFRRADVPLYALEGTLQGGTPAKWFVVMAPTSPYSAAEAAHIRRYVEQGGNLLVMSGRQHKREVAEILNAFGLSVGDSPLGGHYTKVMSKGMRESLGQLPHSHATGADSDLGFRMFDSYPIKGEAEVVATTLDQPTVVRKKVGKGTALVFSDSRFPLGDHLGRDLNVNLAATRFLYECITEADR